jgi:D-alanine-D-alanine ligase
MSPTTVPEKRTSTPLRVAYDVDAAAVLTRHNPLHPYAPDLERLKQNSDAFPLAEALTRAGRPATPLALGPNALEALHALTRERPPLVFNLCDTLGGEGAPALLVPTVLDALGIPYTGADARGLALTKSKHALKALLASEGVPTPRFQCIHDAAGAESFSLALEPPVVLKPCGEHASIGLEAASIAWNDGEVRARARHLLGRFGGPVLVEEYVGGREFYVSVAGHPLRALPLMEQTFVDLPEGYLRMRTFDAKWFTEPGLSGDAPLLARDERWRQPVPTRQPASPWRRHETVEELCVRAFRLAGGRDWGRVEFRLDAGGVPLLIDITPNSYLAPSAPCVLAAKEAGMSYEGFLTLIAEGALGRGPTGS